MTLKFNIVTDDGEETSVTAFVDGRTLVATKEHTTFDDIIKNLRLGADEAQVLELFDAGVAINARFNKVSERVSIRNGFVFFDNMKQNSVLSSAILTFFASGQEDFMALVNFMEKIEMNPNPHSREHLFRWLKVGRFGITPEGDIIAYKAVNRATGMNAMDASQFESIHNGPAIVDGYPVNGKVPNKPGTIIEMARDDVTFDPSITCSQGLHVADWSYAKEQMSGTYMLRVLVNPRDVVSVPNDHYDKKMRVCRYKVLDSVTTEDKTMLNVDRRLQLLTSHFETLQPRKPSVVVSKKAAKAAPVTPRTGGGAGAVAKKVAVKKAVPAATNAAAKVPSKMIKGAPKPPAPPAPPKLPKFYEEFTKENFASLPYVKLVWLAKQWEIKPVDRTTAAHVTALVKAAKLRIKKVSRPSDKTKTA